MSGTAPEPLNHAAPVSGGDAVAGSGVSHDAGPLLVVLSGPSGVGKDAVLAELRKRRPDLQVIVTATTRPRRSDERDGIDYEFVSHDEFDELQRTGGLLEFNQYANGHFYGVPRAGAARAIAAGHDAMVRTDVGGARSIKRLAPAAVLIYLRPPSLAALQRRIELRGSESAGSLASRMELAPAELAALPEFDYAVLNEDGKLNRAVAQVEAILTAEHCRVARQPVRL